MWGILLLTIGLSSQAYTSSVELFGGAITYHFVDEGSSDQFVHKLSKNGRLIYNQLYGLRYIGEGSQRYAAVAVFMGNNSVGLPMKGALFSLGEKYLNNKIYLGLVAGGYIQDDTAFRAKEARPFRLFEFDHGKGFVPIIGVEGALRLNLTADFYAKIYLLITPIVTTSLLMAGLTF